MTIKSHINALCKATAGLVSLDPDRTIVLDAGPAFSPDWKTYIAPADGVVTARTSRGKNAFLGLASSVPVMGTLNMHSEGMARGWILVNKGDTVSWAYGSESLYITFIPFKYTA